MNSCLLGTYIEDENIKSACDFVPEKINDGLVVYEVIKVVDGVPLFFDQHFLRLKNSTNHAGINCPTKAFATESIKILIQINKLHRGNIRFQLTQKPNGSTKWFCWVNPYFYPNQTQITEGVRVGLHQAERKEPTLKIWNNSFKISIESALKLHNYYELLLVNQNNEITEGSRSNIFFIRNNCIITSPKSKVLPGVTHSVILDILEMESIDWSERLVHIDELKTMDAAFLSGTSPGILPIQSIENMNLDAKHGLISKIYSQYSKRCQANLINFVW